VAKAEVAKMVLIIRATKEVFFMALFFNLVRLGK